MDRSNGWGLAIGAIAAAGVASWLWSLARQSAVDDRTRDRLTQRTPDGTVPSAADIHVGTRPTSVTP